MSTDEAFRRLLHVDRGTAGVQRAIDDELAFHFEMSVRGLMNEGLSRADAEREAIRRFGDARETRERLRKIDRVTATRAAWREWGSSVVQDLRYAIRGVRKQPAFAAVVVLTLALGIGATSTMFGIVDRLLLRAPDHVVHPASLRRIYAHVRTKSSGEFTTSISGYSTYSAIRVHSRSVAQTAVYNVNEARTGRGLESAAVRVGATSGNFFAMLGVHPARGRFFGDADDHPPEGAHVVVLDYGYWQRQYAGLDSVIGRTLVLDEQPFTIIGVAPPNFTGVELRPVQLWIPISSAHHPTPDWWTTWQAQWLNVVVRVKPGLTDSQVDEDLTTTFRSAYGGTEDEWKLAELSARPIAYTSSGTEGPEAPIARWLAAVAIIVLIIATANVANLLIVRLLRRQREIAVRLALGVSQSRLARLLTMEGLVYAVLGGAAGVGLAWVGAETMRRVFLSNVAWDSTPVDTRTLIVAILLTVTTGVIVALAPLLQSRRTDIVATLRGTAGAGGTPQTRTRFVLLVIQAAFSVLLLTGAGLFIRSLAKVRGLDLGVQPDRVLVAEVGWPRLRNASPAVAAAERVRQSATWVALRDRLTSARGVAHAALAIGSPFGYGFGVTLKLPGRDSLPAAPGGGPYVNAVTSDYFATVGTPLVRGRVFRTNEGATTERVAIVNETMAKLLWPREDPLGKCMIVGDDETRCSSVVGVVRDARRYGIREEPAMQYYIPFGQEAGIGGTVLLVRPGGDAQSYVSSLRRTIATVVPDASVIDIALMQDRVDPQIRPWRLGATMFGLFGAIALVVAAIGLYSVVSYVTAQRTHEIGVRLAIGAGARRIIRLIVTDGMRVAVIGVAVGLVLALLTSHWIAPLLFSESARDPWVYLAVTAVLLAVAAIACLAPAVRAARVDPVKALRDA